MKTTEFTYISIYVFIDVNMNKDYQSTPPNKKTFSEVSPSWIPDLGLWSLMIPPS